MTPFSDSFCTWFGITGALFSAIPLGHGHPAHPPRKPTLSSTTESDQLTIDALKEIVCDQKKATCTAIGHAQATKGPLRVESDLLRVTFEKTEDAPDMKASPRLQKPQKIEAEGNVRITRALHRASAQNTAYDLAQGLIRLTGRPLLQTPQGTLFSESPMSIWQLKGIGETTGAIFNQAEKDNTLKANHIRLHFDPHAKEQHITALEGWGGVLLTTPRQVVRAEQARYDATTETIHLKGHVEAAEGANIIMGDQAILDLDHGTLKITAQAQQTQTPQRIRAVFVPESLTTRKSLS